MSLYERTLTRTKHAYIFSVVTVMIRCVNTVEQAILVSVTLDVVKKYATLLLTKECTRVVDRIFTSKTCDKICDTYNSALL